MPAYRVKKETDKEFKPTGEVFVGTKEQADARVIQLQEENGGSYALEQIQKGEKP